MNTVKLHRKRLLEKEDEDEEETKQNKRQKTLYDNRFVTLINNKHMFSIIHSFIGNDTITAARMRSAFPLKALNPYFGLLLKPPSSYQLAIKYIEADNSVQVFVRSVPPDYDHDARDKGERYERIDTSIAIVRAPSLQFFMYMRPDELPLNKHEYCESFKSIDLVPSFYIKNAYTFVLDYSHYLTLTRSELCVHDSVLFNRLISKLQSAHMIFLDNPIGGYKWLYNKRLLHPRTKYQIQDGSDVAIRVLDHEYSVYYSDLRLMYTWGRKLNRNENRIHACKW